MRNDYVNRSIDEFELSARAWNCLKKADIRTIRGLMQMTRRDLLKLKNFGLKSLGEVEGILCSMGLALRLEAWEESRELELLRSVINGLNLSNEVTAFDWPDGALTVEVSESDALPTFDTLREALIHVLSYIPIAERLPGERRFRELPDLNQSSNREEQIK